MMLIQIKMMMTVKLTLLINNIINIIEKRYYSIPVLYHIQYLSYRILLL